MFDERENFRNCVQTQDKLRKANEDKKHYLRWHYEWMVFFGDVTFELRKNVKAFAQSCWFFCCCCCCCECLAIARSVERLESLCNGIQIQAVHDTISECSDCICECFAEQFRVAADPRRRSKAESLADYKVLQDVAETSKVAGDDLNGCVNCVRLDLQTFQNGNTENNARVDCNVWWGRRIMSECLSFATFQFPYFWQQHWNFQHLWLACIPSCRSSNECPWSSVVDGRISCQVSIRKLTCWRSSVESPSSHSQIHCRRSSWHC